jgi:AcrR family transcriptional regulator
MADDTTSVASTPRGRTARQLLLRTSAELLREAPRLEVATVARRAKVSTGLLYHYFGSKDGLVRAVVDDFYDRYDEAVFLAPLVPEATWAERELLRLRREVDFIYDADLGPTVVGNRLQEPGAVAADAQRLARHIDFAARNVGRGQASGEIGPDVDSRLAAAAILGAFRSLAGEALARTKPPAREEVVDTIWRLGLSILPLRDQPGTGEETA